MEHDAGTQVHTLFFWDNIFLRSQLKQEENHAKPCGSSKEMVDGLCPAGEMHVVQQITKNARREVAQGCTSP